jgi:curved DNA-binding protein CbpA
MPDLYRVLGLSPRAREEDIKSAYRALAKRAHPDVNAGDAAAELRTKEINRAYETLRNTETRAAYDTVLARQRADRRRRIKVGATAFVLAVASTLGAYWAQPWDTGQAKGTASIAFTSSESEPLPGPGTRESQAYRPPGGHEARPRDPATAALVESALQRSSPRQAALTDPEETGPPAASAAPLNRMDETGTWALHKNARLGFELRYPAHIFAPRGGYAGERLRLMVSRDSRAVLSFFFADGTTDQLAAYRRSLMDQRYAGARIEETEQGEGRFELSGTLGAEAFYEHVAVSCDGRSMAGWQVVYPLAERAFYATVVEEMRRGYRQDGAPGAGCGRPGSRVTDVKRQRLAP